MSSNPHQTQLLSPYAPAERVGGRRFAPSWTRASKKKKNKCVGKYETQRIYILSRARPVLGAKGAGPMGVWTTPVV